ncbi:MAG: RDD family protein [Microlunatus sp.]|nr:RDD family protein [Microlunatus sp.]
MSDIPIGSPPVPPGRHAAPQGWYPDPVDQRRERYWDGWSWSRNTREAQQFGALPPGQLLPGPFDQGPYQQGPYQQGPHQQGPYQQGPHQQGSYQQDPDQGQHGYPYGPYPQAPYQQSPGRSGVVPLTADGVPTAGWGWRFLAGVLDLIIVTVVADIFSIPFLLTMIPVVQRYFREVIRARQSGGVLPTLNPTDLISGTDQSLITVVSIVVGLLYFSLLWRYRGATVGQLACGLRVVPVDQGHNTERLPWASALVRAVIWWVPIAVSSVLLIFTVINVLFPLGSPKRQAIHDLVAKTQIVKIR